LGCQLGIEVQEQRLLLERLIADISDSNGMVATDRFPGLRDVDAKVREFRMILRSLPGAAGLLAEADKDDDFSANSRRVRLEALSNHCRTAIRLLGTPVASDRRVITEAPDLSPITSIALDLDRIIRERWLEAQKCQLAEAYIAAVIMMGSVLEGLLLARAQMSPADAFRCSQAPRTRDGKNLPIHEWNLNQLINVAVDLGWLKSDRGKFSHALRDSRNIVHPWGHLAAKADFDLATCETCWHVLNASLSDLLSTV
jgi:hypothetical protein